MWSHRVLSASPAAAAKQMAARRRPLLSRTYRTQTAISEAVVDSYGSFKYNGLYAAGSAAAALLFFASQVQQEDNAVDSRKEDGIVPIECADGTTVKPWSCPTRTSQLKRLKQETFDVLVIGGGCVGAGVALEGSTRGLKVGMIERSDIAAGTSGRSTKLIHGGIRYLETAFKKLDYESYELVKEALHERAHLLHAAPFMAKPLPIMIPLYTWWEIPYMYVGAKMYDLIAGKNRAVPRSYFISKEEALYQFPMLRHSGLKGAIVYYDGQHNDTRMNVLIALTAAQSGAAVANYVEAKELLKDNVTNESGETITKIVGVRARDALTGEEWDVKAKAVVNATGPFADHIRYMDDPSAPEAIVPAAGVHTIIPDHFSPDRMGLIVPKTKDGRVLFFLPWEGSTICGTTDSKSNLTMYPTPAEKDIQFILDESNRFLSKRVNRSDVKSAWSGLRPLVRDAQQLQKLREEKLKAVEEGRLEQWMEEQKKNTKETKGFSRKHVVEVSDSGLISIMGGKWTTYRQMAEDSIGEIEKHPRIFPNFHAEPSRTAKMQFVGADRARIVANQNFDRITVTLREKYDFDKDVALHLVSNYGTRALQIAELAVGERNLGQAYKKDLSSRIFRKYPFVWAEVLFAVEQEYARTVIDFLARRTRIIYLDTEAAKGCVDEVIRIMGDKLGWSRDERKRQREEFDRFVQTMT